MTAVSAIELPVPSPIEAAGITFRLWGGFDDLPGMTAVNEAVRRHAGVLQPIDVEEMRHFYANLRTCDLATDILIAERDGVICAYGRSEWQDLADGSRLYALAVLVHPDVAGQGVAAALLAWAETRATAQAAAHPTDRPSAVGTITYAKDQELDSAVRAAGYRPVRRSAEMLRATLDDLPEEAVPDGYVIRTPQPAELPAIFDMFVLAFDETFGEIEGGDRTFDAWVGDPEFRRDLLVVAFHNGAPIAGVDNHLDTSADGSLRGLLDTVGTHPAHRRRGLARATIARSLHLLRDAGATSAYLNVDTSNADRALELYESCGFRQVTGGITYRRPFGPSSGVPDLRIRHATIADWPALADVVNRARRADGVDEVHTAESWANEYPESEMFQVERDMLVAEVDGEVIAEAAGYLVARDGLLVAESFGAVVPEYRRRGIGTALYEATHARLTAAAATDPRPGSRERRAYALDDERADRAMLDANGYVPIRFGFEMRRWLTGALPEHPLPGGLELRPVEPGQHRAIFEADNEAFRDHWGHREQDESDFDKRFHGPETDTSLWCVAWDGDQVVGSVQNYIFVEENEALGITRGWLDHVSVRRAWRGKGVAKALCAASFRVLREHGMTEAWLGVDAANPTGALALYETLGFGVVRRWQAFGRPMDRPAPAGWRTGQDASQA